MSRVTDSTFPTTAFRLYRGDVGGEASGLNTTGQRFGEHETWRVPHADYVRLTNCILGSLEIVGGSTGALIRRVGLRHPEYDNLMAESYTSKRVGWNKRVGTTPGFWAWHDVTVYFRSPTFELDGADAFLSVATAPSTRTIPFPPSMMRVGGLATNYDSEFPVDGMTLTLTTHQLPSLPLTTYYSYQSCVNSTTFRGFAVGTVKYVAPTSNFTGKVTGFPTYEVTHTFEISKIPWNYGFSTTGALSDMTYNSGVLRHPQIDLNLLFTS